MNIEPEEDIDDIYMSSCLALRSRKHHIVTSALNGKIEELKRWGGTGCSFSTSKLGRVPYHCCKKIF